jgi:hypothetical protein
MCADFVPRPDRAERTILVGLVCAGVPRHIVDEHLDELDRLVNTAGGEVVERQVQERDAPDPATIVGSGFLARLADRCAAERVETVVFDEDLTGSQARNLERALPEDVRLSIGRRLSWTSLPSGLERRRPRPRSSSPSSVIWCPV